MKTLPDFWTESYSYYIISVKTIFENMKYWPLLEGHKLIANDRPMGSLSQDILKPQLNKRVKSGSNVFLNLFAL